MNLHLIDGSAGIIWIILGPIGLVVAILGFISGFLVENRRLGHVWFVVAGLTLLLFGISIIGSTLNDNGKRDGNIAAVKDAAANTYGLQLSDRQATNLLGKQGLNGNNDAEQFGSTLLFKGDTVQKVQLVHPGDRWLIIDAGTRSELAHD